MVISTLSCTQRHPPAAARPDASHTITAVSASRCNDEIAHGSIALVPGSGPIETVLAACGEAHRLAVFTLRGHTLARTVRSLARVSPFGVPLVIATGADRLGPMGLHSFDGPLAWRSPTVPDVAEMLDREQWWVGGVTGTTVQRGSVLWPAGVVTLGVTAPVAHTASETTVLGTMARAGESPALVHAVVAAPRDEVVEMHTTPASMGVGELRSMDVEGGRAIAFVGNAAGGNGALVALGLQGGALVERGRIALDRGNVLVVQRGASDATGSWFAYASFAVAPAASSDCLALDEQLCVAPGAVSLMHISAAGMREVRTGPGLPDSLAVTPDGTVQVLWVDAHGEPHAGQLGLHDAAIRERRVRALAGLPPFDHPSLIACDEGTWWVAEVRVPTGTGTAGDGESGLIALPYECLVEP